MNPCSKTSPKNLFLREALAHFLSTHQPRQDDADLQSGISVLAYCLNTHSHVRVQTPHTVESASYCSERKRWTAGGIDMLSMNCSSFSPLQTPYTVESASYCAELKRQAYQRLMTVAELFPIGYCYVSCRRRTRWKAQVTARSASAGRRAATTCGCTCTTMTPARNWTSTRVGLLLFRPGELL